MRHGSAKNEFDVSDSLPQIDNVEGVLEVAAGVHEDYGPNPGATRIERMARWITLNLGVLIPATTRVGGITRFDCEKFIVWRVGGCVGLATIDAPLQPEPLTHDQARALGVALFRAVEETEAEE